MQSRSAISFAVSPSASPLSTSVSLEDRPLEWDCSFLLLNRIDSTAPAISDTGLSLPTHLNASSTQSRLSTSVFSFRGIKKPICPMAVSGVTNQQSLSVCGTVCSRRTTLISRSEYLSRAYCNPTDCSSVSPAVSTTYSLPCTAITCLRLPTILRSVDATIFHVCGRCVLCLFQAT